MDDKLKEKCDSYFDNVLFPVLTPLAVDTSRPFPFLANKTLNIAVRLAKDSGDAFAVVQVPSIIPRFFEVSRILLRITSISFSSFILLKLTQISDLQEIQTLILTKKQRI